MHGINRNEETDYPLTIDIKGFEGYKVSQVTSMPAENLEVRNEFGNEFIKPETVSDYTLQNGEFKVRIKPLSWNVYVFEG